MANRLYPKGAEKILSGSINLISDTIKVALLSDAYTYSASHEFLSHGGVACTSQPLHFVDVVTGLPMATNGGDITIQWDNGSYKIFSLVP